MERNGLYKESAEMDPVIWHFIAAKHSYKDAHIDGDPKAHLGDSYNLCAKPFHVLIKTER